MSIWPEHWLSNSFSSRDALKGHCHIWQEMYSLPHTQMLGFVACRVTSKHLVLEIVKGCKLIQRWENFYMSGYSLEMSEILYTSVI